MNIKELEAKNSLYEWRRCLANNYFLGLDIVTSAYRCKNLYKIYVKQRNKIEKNN